MTDDFVATPAVEHLAQGRLGKPVVALTLTLTLNPNPHHDPNQP